MKIFDCTLYHDEDLILDLRLNILSKYVDKFVICESTFSHSGRKKKLNFDINKFSNFKDKIIYIVSDDEPEGLVFDKNSNDRKELPENYRHNAINRIAHQTTKRNNLGGGTGNPSTPQGVAHAQMLDQKINWWQSQLPIHNCQPGT